MKIRSFAAVSAIVLAGLSLTACSASGSASSDPKTQIQEQLGQFSSSDIMFLQMMIPHHQQAVDMGTLAEAQGFSPTIKALATQIKSEQSPEITKMADWVTAAGASVKMDQDMGMGGMLSDSEITALKAAKGANFDKLFLKDMITHHSSAVAMAVMVMHSQNASIKSLSKAIIDSQSKEIQYMQGLLKTLG